MKTLIFTVLTLLSLQSSFANSKLLEKYKCVTTSTGEKSEIEVNRLYGNLSIHYISGLTSTIFVDTDEIDFEYSKTALNYYSKSDRRVKNPWFGMSYRRQAESSFYLDKVTLRGHYSSYLKEGWSVKMDEEEEFTCKQII